ncbi:hypothetical protein QT890_15165, partial [Xanthomonas fragariae]|nr:hypothetical protein [Xanthomonas fragariae]MDM7558960.1 hypothetical protein [Xanthomonas fragariae]
MPADELFRSRLENQIDLRHPLARLSQRMPWTALEQALSSRLPATQAGGGRPALPVRLIAGLLYLKHAYDLSDARRVKRTNSASRSALQSPPARDWSWVRAASRATRTTAIPWP